MGKLGPSLFLCIELVEPTNIFLFTSLSDFFFRFYWQSNEIACNPVKSCIKFVVDSTYLYNPSSSPSKTLSKILDLVASCRMPLSSPCLWSCCPPLTTAAIAGVLRPLNQMPICSGVLHFPWIKMQRWSYFSSSKKLKNTLGSWYFWEGGLLTSERANGITSSCSALLEMPFALW